MRSRQRRDGQRGQSPSMSAAALALVLSAVRLGERLRAVAAGGVAALALG
jgi:hypothetical protein